MRRLLLAVLFSVVALDTLAAVPKVTITGKVIAPDGLTYAGTINCVLSAPATATDGGTSVRVQSTGTLTIASDGTVSGSLVANDITTPVTSYTCTTRINRTPVYTQTELIYLTTGSGTVDWGAVSRPGATPYTPVGVTGSAGAVQSSNGTGGLLDTGVTAAAGALTAKQVNGVMYAQSYVSGGSGTYASPWTGWETSVNAAAQGATVHFGKGVYKAAVGLTPDTDVTYEGEGSDNGTTYTAGTLIMADTVSFPAGGALVSATGKDNVKIRDLALWGGSSVTHPADRGIYLTGPADSALIQNVALHYFNGPCIHLASSGSSNTAHVENVDAQNCVMGTSLASQSAAFYNEWSDSWVSNSIFYTQYVAGAGNRYTESGKRACVYTATGTGMFATNVHANKCEIGFYLNSNYNTLSGVHAGDIGGEAVKITGSGNRVVGLFVNGASQDQDSTSLGTGHDAVVVSGNSNVVSNSYVANGINSLHVRYGFYDSSSANSNAYFGNYADTSKCFGRMWQIDNGNGRWVGPGTATTFDALDVDGNIVLGRVATDATPKFIKFRGSSIGPRFLYDNSIPGWEFDTDGTVSDTSNVQVKSSDVRSRTFTLNNATSGTITQQAVTGALGAQTVTWPAASGTVVLNQSSATSLNPDTDNDGTGTLALLFKGDSRIDITREATLSSTWLTGGPLSAERIVEWDRDSSSVTTRSQVERIWKWTSFDGTTPAAPYIAGLRFGYAPGSDSAAFGPYYEDIPGGTFGLDHGMALGTPRNPWGLLSLIGCHNTNAGFQGLTQKCGGATGTFQFINRETNSPDFAMTQETNSGVADVNRGLIGLHWWHNNNGISGLQAGDYCLYKYGIDWDCDNTTDFHRDPGSASAGVTVANTVSETTLIGTMHGSATIPANTMEVGSTLRITAWGYHSVTATPTIRIRTKLGGTTFCDSTALTVSNTGAMTWKAECYITTRAAPGATVATIGQGIATFFTAASTPVQGQTATTSTTNLATNGALAVDVTAQWSAASASNTITMTNLTIDRVN